MRDLLAGFFLYFIILASVANGQDFGRISQNNIPNAKIQLTYEAVSPSWRLVWDEAREMVKKNELDGAVALYRELLRDRQGLVEARWELGLVLMQLNKESQAILEFERVVEAKPDDIQALFILAKLLSCSGQCDKAIAVYKNLVEELNLRGEDFHIAKNELFDINEELTLVKIIEGLCRCLKSQKRFNESIEYLMKALAIEPDRKDLEFDLACCLLRIKKAKKASHLFKKLLPQYENDTDFLAAYAEALLALGDRDESTKILERFVILSSDNTGKAQSDNLIWGVNELVSLYLMEGDVHSAIKVIEDLKHNHPKVLDKNLLATAGRLYFASHNYLKALDTFRIFLKEEPDNKKGLMFIARTYECLQLLTPAISIYKQLLLLEPGSSITMHLAKLFLEIENFDQASLLITEDMRGRLKNDTKGRKLLLDIYLGNGDAERVEELLDSESVFLKDDDILSSYVSLVTSIGYIRTQRGFRLYEDALLALAAQAEKRRDLLQAGVKLLVSLGRQDTAERVLRCCWSEGRSLWSADMMVNRYLERNKWEEAVALLENAISVYPSSARLKLKRVYLLLNMARAELALESLLSIYVDNNWQWGKEKRQLCEAYANSLSGRYEEALDIYGQIIQEAPNHLEAHRGRWFNFEAYGLGHEADAEARGLEIITGIGCKDLSANGDNEKFVPVFVTNDKVIPSPGAYLEGFVCNKNLLPPKEILSSAFCEMEGEACPLLLALSYEHFKKFPEAIMMWRTFLKRHDTYWPGYERLARIYESKGEADSAQKLMYRTCCKIKQLQLFFYYGKDNNKIKTVLEEAAASDIWMWQELDFMALESWEGVFCSN
ncbi:MAG: hypothetical protein AVO38_02900 [delta proteobacterium ML8_D]|jgi:tetratricopeptide (TPR) repeat protein|nr:MAG: hypothetical protein AVO38_02900 [delta proteobacterium ML8_D]